MITPPISTCVTMLGLGSGDVMILFYPACGTSRRLQNQTCVPLWFQQWLYMYIIEYLLPIVLIIQLPSSLISKGPHNCGYQVLYVVIKCCMWLSSAVYGYQMLCVVIKCCVWLSSAVYGYQVLCVVIKCCVWLSSAVCG